MKYDIEIEGNGFYLISGNTKRGAKWMRENVQGVIPQTASVPCDDSRYTEEIADGAFDEGLRVRVNGKQYLGDGKVKVA